MESRAFRLSIEATKPRIMGGAVVPFFAEREAPDKTSQRANGFRQGADGGHS
jgi:hypothetical protein